MLTAGAARVDITPEDLGRTWLAGFGINRRPLGVLDPLEANALYLSDGEREVALVSVDCIGLSRPFVERVRGKLPAFRDPGGIILCATHTHSGPDTLGLWGPGPLGAFPLSSGVDPEYQATLASRIAEAVTRARLAAEPALVRAAAFGTPAEWTRNERPGARFDRAAALGLEREDGTRIATLLNWASHPETLWEDNRWVSPDYPGHFRNAVRSRVGGEALFFSGPLGAMLTPNSPIGRPFADRVHFIEKLGADLARLTLDELSRADPESLDQLTHAWGTVGLPNHNWVFSLMRRLGIVDYDWRRGAVQCELHHLQIGPLSILTVPGEPAPEVARALLARVPAGPQALFALAIDEIGYVLSPEQLADARYKYERQASLGEGTAGLLEAATAALVGRRA